MEKSGALLMVFLGLLVTVSQTVVASDPDLTTDFNVTNPNAGDFTFTFNATQQAPGKAMPFFAAFNLPPTFPGLNGLGLTAALFEFGPNSQIDPHTHPRGTELFYVLYGTVEVGFVDTTNTLFETTLQAGQLFVFPKGLLHFQRNNQNSAACGYSVLSSENPGTLLIAKALFNASGTGLPDNVLEAALGTNAHRIDAIKRSVAAGASSTPPSPSPFSW